MIRPPAAGVTCRIPQTNGKRSFGGAIVIEPPFCRILPIDQIERIHRAGCRILSDVGLQIRDTETLDALKGAGAEVDAASAMVRFPFGWLEETLASAPSRFVLHSRDGKNDLQLGSGQVYFSNGGRVFRILDGETDTYRPTLLRDVACSAALVERLEHIHLFIIPCQAHDAASDHYHLNDFYHALNHTRKHVMGGCDTLQDAKEMFALASAVAGGDGALRAKPFVSVITNPVSPLILDPEALKVFLFCCKNGIPATCAAAPISGATAPGTLAGTLAQGHAEILGAAAVAQTVAPGARVLYGAVPSIMDLRTMDCAMGAVESTLMNAAAVQLAGHCGLPIYASGGVTEAKGPDIQSGTEKSLSLMAAALQGADLIHLAAGMLDSGNSISFEQYVIDNEMIGMIRRLLAGIRVDEGTIGFDAVKESGPGGNFVLAQHTVDHMTSEFFYPELAVRSNFDIWERKGHPTMLSRARETVRRILEDAAGGVLAPELNADILKRFPGIRPVPPWRGEKPE